MQDICVIGLGNMGVSVLAAWLARGHRAVAADVDPDKVRLTAAGQCVVPEPGIDEVLTRAVSEGRLRATTDLADALAATDLCFIAVPTPPDDQGEIEYRHLERLLTDIGGLLAGGNRGYAIVIGSTVFPGAVRDRILPLLTGAGVRIGPDAELAISPVFLRAGSGLADYLDPGRIVIGIEGDPQQRVRAYVQAMFPDRDDAWFVDYQTAECVKAVHNEWMSLKVTFANEAGRWCRAAGADGREVMDIVLSDRQRLLSRSHLTPGPPFSGPCLPKDALAMLRSLDHFDAACPMFEAIHRSNEVYKRELFDQVLQPMPHTGQPAGCLGILGVSFKPDFNELRWSIGMELTEIADAAGWQVQAYDRAFVGCSVEAYRLASRGAEHLDRWFEAVRRPLSEVWAQADRVFVNMSLSAEELDEARDASSAGPKPRIVVDLYGDTTNRRLADLEGVRYVGACW